jgi:decaprenyl-phosphate phosphoribosyltransferase
MTTTEGSPPPTDATDDDVVVRDGAGATGAPEAPGAPPQPATLLVGLVRLARPKQWAKNVLVFAAPAAAGRLDEWGPFWRSVVAFVCFCAAAAGTYYINDARDVDADRLHPVKRFRPVAAGIVPVPAAFAIGTGLLVGAVAASFTASWQLALTVLAYVALTTAYSVVLKHIAVVDLVAVAAGFVLRAVAGAEATHVHISDWFFIITIFGSLFMVVGKRGAEAAEMGEGAGSVRPVLAAYSKEYMAYLRAVTTAAVLVSYCQWAFVKATESGAALPWYQATILPFVMGVLRYGLVLDQGRGSAPEDIVLGDRTLQLIGLAWAVVFGIGVYTA